MVWWLVVVVVVLCCGSSCGELWSGGGVELWCASGVSKIYIVNTVGYIPCLSIAERSQ